MTPEHTGGFDWLRSKSNSKAEPLGWRQHSDPETETMRLRRSRRSQASLGQIFEQKYRPWDGELGPRWMRNYAIFRHHVYGVFTGKGHRQYHPMVRLLILIIFLASLTPIPMLFLSSFIGDQGGFFEKMWGINRYNLWGQVLGYFPRNLCMWPLLTAIVVGA